MIPWCAIMMRLSTGAVFCSSLAVTNVTDILEHVCARVGICASGSAICWHRAGMFAGSADGITFSVWPCTGAQAQSRDAEGTAVAAVSSSGAAARGAKAATVKARAAADRKLSGARATAAARTRTHTAWGKRHVEKAGKDAFQRPTQVSSTGATNTTLYNATKVILLPNVCQCWLCP